MINLRVRFQPFEVFRLSFNGALFPNPIPREPSDSESASRRRLDANTHTQSSQTLAGFSDSHYYFRNGFNFAERLSSAMNVLGAEYAARSIIRDKHVHSL
jgi:hypothetical protein